MPKFELIGLDADDTLWHTERHYVEAQKKFAQLLSRYHSADWVQERLDQTENRNIAHYGYGIKAFALSMIETAVELTEGRVSGADILTLLKEARNMLSRQVELIDKVEETVPRLAQSHRLALITKGDLLDQETKIARSGLEKYFEEVEIVSQKTPEAYARLLSRLNVRPERFLMVGNSLKSDILPVLEIHGHAAHIPGDITWQHEMADAPATGTPGFYSLEDFGQLPELIEKLETL
ncbi:MAG TPA: HAD family hydrolase [Anaerolineales bacterium]|jgi:putative hydrolase of the HAD superfamily